MASYIFGGNTGETPETIARKRALAERIMGQSPAVAPRSTLDGIGNAFASIMEGVSARGLRKEADSGEQAGLASGNTLFNNIVDSIKTGSPIVPSGTGSFATSSTQPMDYASQRVGQAHGDPATWRDAIASIESAGSGDYQAVGPKHPRLGRALGRYQVMEANVGPWTEKHLGRRLTPEEFLASPEAQDAVFDGEFGGYVQQFGDPALAAQAWFAGPGGVGTNRKDSLGTSVPEYAQRFQAALNENPQSTQAQLESLPVGGSMTMPDEQPAAPVQVAQAGGGPMPAGQQMGGLDIQQLIQAASHPWLNEGQRAVINSLLQQQLQTLDPAHQLDMDYRRAQINKMQREALGLGDAAKVQTSVVLDDGTSVLVMNNGQRRVLSPTGEEVRGQAAADAIRSAREYTVQNQQDIYAARRAGTLGSDIELGGTAAGAKKSGEKTMEAGFSAWEDYNKLQGSIANIDEAIAALDNGAKAGIVYNMLPNVTEASASLKNALDRMGLDIIGAVTFGALSEGEMRLAMDTAAPRDLGPKELRNWLERKRDAQEKAARTLSDAAMFLTVPGNTINDWIALNRSRKQGQSGAASGGDGWQDIGGVRIRRKQ